MGDFSDLKPMYFGNDDQQTDVIEKLEAAVKAEKSKMHLVGGGPSSGKSNAIEMVRQSIGASGKFDCLVEPDQLAVDDIPHDVPKKIALLIREMDGEEKGLYTQHYVFKSHDKPFFIVVADGETAPAEADALNALKKAAKLVKEAKKDGYELLWIADAPVRHQAIPIFKPNAEAATEVKSYAKAIDGLKKQFGNTVVSHHLRYDMDEIKKTLWRNIADEGKDFLERLSHTTHKTSDSQNKEEWERAAQAALCGDSDAYDKAFRVLAARAKSAAKAVA